MTTEAPNEALPADEGTDDIEIVELPPSNYPDCIDDVDEKRRAYVVAYVCSPDIDAKIAVMNCELIRAWLQSGELPPREPKIKSVKA